MKSGPKWYKNRVTWVVIIAVFSACSLLIIQGIWLKRAFEDETQRLNADLNRALPEFLFYQPDVQLLDFVSLDFTATNGQQKVLEHQIEHTITTSLESSNITANFAYALLNGTRDSILFTNAPEYHAALKKSEYQKCINCREIKHLPLDSLADGSTTYDYLISITDEIILDGDAEKNRIYISLYFPDFDQMILKNILSQLILVVLFVVLIIGCFFYILRIVFRQKKISEIKDDFINSLTHEFKTPLASMSLATTVVKESLSKHLSDRDRHHFNLIRNEQTSLENQIDKVLQMAMADAGNFELDFERVELHQLTRDTLASLELFIQQKQGVIQLKPAFGEFFVKGDATHLANVLYNLIDNALKYSNQAPIIEVSIGLAKNSVTVTVKDNGIGIAIEAQKMIFDKFYRVHQQEVSNSQGFGLGLSYVKRIINQHGGHVSLESTPDEGSIFVLSLPMDQSHV